MDPRIMRNRIESSFITVFLLLCSTAISEARVVNDEGGPVVRHPGAGYYSNYFGDDKDPGHGDEEVMEYTGLPLGGPGLPDPDKEDGRPDPDTVDDRRDTGGEDEILDPFEQRVINAGNEVLEYSSYAMEDIDVGFDNVLKLDASSIFRKEADLSGGLDAVVDRGGFAELKVYAYDQHKAKHLIYHLNLGPGEGTAGEFHTGTVPTERIRLYADETTPHHEVPGDDIRQLMQRVDDAYHLSKEDLMAFIRKENAAHAHYESTDTRHRRGFWGKVFGFAVTVGAFAAFGAGVAIALPFLLPGVAVGGMAAGALLGAGVGLIPGLSLGISAGDKLGDLLSGQTESTMVPVHGSPFKEDIAEVDKDRRLHPMGTYPIQVVLRLKKASFYNVKIPGFGQPLPATYFTVTNAYAPNELDRLTATDYWLDTSRFNDGVNAAPPASDYSYLKGDFQYTNTCQARVTVNPGTDASSMHYYSSPTTRNPTVQAKLGDVVMFELLVPLSQSHPLDKNDHVYYPKLSGFPYAWRAFFGGETLYQCEPGIRPGEWRPWLGFDSQVHGAALRRYPVDYKKKFNDWDLKLVNRNRHALYRWTATITRRMDADKASYTPVHTWNKKKSDPISQRNNQKEGLNMEIYRMLKKHSTATDTIPDFGVYRGPEFMSGFDPDEFLYFHTANGAVSGIYKINSEPWKFVPEDEAENPINDIVTAYKKNRLWQVDGLDYRILYGPDYQSLNYEIQDMGTSTTHPDGDASGNAAAPGRVSLKVPEALGFRNTVFEFRIDADPRLRDEDRGFYGSISGDFTPSEWERGVPYRLHGLLAEEIDNYAVCLTREDHLGRQTYYQFRSEHAPEHVKTAIRDTGIWNILLPSYVGFGYHALELWHKNPNYEDSWTRIAGREIIPDSLRFYSVPGSLGPDDGFEGVDLRESPGDGTYIYLEEYLDAKSGNWAEWRYNAGRYGKFQARTYVINKGETLTFEAQDADPHLFAHRDVEWYLSEKRQAKQLPESYLQDHLRHYMDVIRADDQSLEDGGVDARGSRLTHTFDKVGKFQVKAAYRGASRVAHRVIVVDPEQRPATLKASVSRRTLTPKEMNWLRSEGVQFPEHESAGRWKLLTLEDLHSHYRYVDGPRMHGENSKQANRFHPGNNYADGYLWSIARNSAHTNPHFREYEIGTDGPAGLRSALDQYDDAAGWRPDVYVRHTSERPRPDDIAEDSVQAFDSMTPLHKVKVRLLFKNTPEAWQLRLPWISFVQDPHVFRTDDFYSYRTRTNIKPIYRMPAMFDPETGAFSGTPSIRIGDDYSPKHLRDVGVHLHLMEDDLKLKRFFMQDLCTGRSILLRDDYDVKVYNRRETSSEVLAVYPDLQGKVGVTVEANPGEHTYEALDRPDYLWHYGSIAPAFTIDDHAGFGDLNAGDRVTLSGTMELRGTNHRDLWKDRLVLAVGSGNAAATTTHAYANSFGYTGDGNTQVYALAAAVAPLAGANAQGNYPPVALIDGRETTSRDVDSHTTRRSAIIAWELSITLAPTWKDYSTGDNPAPLPGHGEGSGHDNGNGVQRHAHQYSLKFDLDYDDSLETTTSGTFYTYSTESIGLSFAVEQGDARYFPNGGQTPDPDKNKWSAAARATNVWSVFTGAVSRNRNAIYPALQPVDYALKIDLSGVESSHSIPHTLFGTNIENIQTKDRYWGNYATDAELVELMRNFPVNWLRFPGGEPTSTFHFDSTTNQMQTTARWGVDLWDTSKPANQRVAAADADFVDFTEFKQIIDYTSATPFVGVNLESAYFFEALEYDELLRNSQYPVTVNKANFLTNYNKSLIQRGLDQARQIAHYLNSSTSAGGLGMNVTHWFLDNESDLATYDNNHGIPGIAEHKPGTDVDLGVFDGDEGRFNMPASHYARMAKDYMDVIDTETGRSGRQNKYIANWSNTKFMRDQGWKTILEQIGDRLSFIDFHTYWNLDGGSWNENLSVAPATQEPFPAYGVSTWDIWKKQLPMQWENQDDDPVDLWGGEEQPVVWGEAVTRKLSYAEYFTKVREVLDANGYQHVRIMMGEWGVAPRGHWRLNPEAYQTTLMFAELFMQVVESGVVDYMATWPFVSEPDWTVTYRANVINNPENGTNEVQGTYYMQQQFAPFLGGKFVPVETGTPDLFAIASWHRSDSLYLAVLNKSSETRAFALGHTPEDSVRGHRSIYDNYTQYKVNRLVPHDEPHLYDNTYSTSAPAVNEGSWTHLSGDNVEIRPYGLIWIQLK